MRMRTMTMTRMTATMRTTRTRKTLKPSLDLALDQDPQSPFTPPETSVQVAKGQSAPLLAALVRTRRPRRPTRAMLRVWANRANRSASDAEAAMTLAQAALQAQFNPYYADPSGFASYPMSAQDGTAALLAASNHAGFSPGMGSNDSNEAMEAAAAVLGGFANSPSAADNGQDTTNSTSLSEAQLLLDAAMSPVSNHATIPGTAGASTTPTRGRGRGRPRGSRSGRRGDRPSNLSNETGADALQTTPSETPSTEASI